VDSMTIIAVASIVIAGITISFGAMGLRWRKGGRSRRR
jgi:type IV secretory pathway VirB2 component (pilin)